jgi:hypothetical protein
MNSRVSMRLRHLWLGYRSIPRQMYAFLSGSRHKYIYIYICLRASESSRSHSIQYSIHGKKHAQRKSSPCARRTAFTLPSILTDVLIRVHGADSAHPGALSHVIAEWLFRPWPWRQFWRLRTHPAGDQKTCSRARGGEGGTARWIWAADPLENGFPRSAANSGSRRTHPGPSSSINAKRETS